MQETMLQEVMTAPREIRFDRVPVPTAGPGQVLVKIKRIGICGSDIHVYHGKHPYTMCIPASIRSQNIRSPRATRSPARSRRWGRESPNSRWVSG